ncbi:Omp28-related outer membrane protein [Marinifilum caeruleilacunae]|uniref:Omp28-related outer membrane protein n=1 Tax=Marinifilum caeruleilacunae TaxID=2499076 RepID=A0ABX1X1J5_9BACT|nr:Omp28-related outer membrane protein [Marinifilum caeruleilacunae]NOU62091.1 hypothetical protein [Marinifilum caeruleilacunae]
MKNFKQWFLPTILFLGIVVSSCSSGGDGPGPNPEPDKPDPTPKESRKNSNVSVSSTDAPASYTTKILLEDYTGTWCGYCPRVAHAMEEAIAQNGNIIGIGVHDDSDMGFTHVKSMLQKYNISGFPTAVLNRSAKWLETFATLNPFLEKESDLGIALESSLNNTTVTGKIKIGFKADLTKSIDYVIYLVEDKVVANQVNYYNDVSSSPYYNKGNPIVGFEHANVLRKTITDVYGDIIPEDYTKTGNVIEADFSVELDTYVPENCYIVAFVLEEGGEEIINTQIVKVGSNQDFD